MSQVFNTEFNVIYLRVMQGCNLNCTHCFTLGDQDPKYTTDLDTIESFLTLLRKNVNPDKAVFYIHGGETFLAPYDYLRSVNNKIRTLFDETEYDIIAQTNLTYLVDDEFIQFIKDEYNGVIGVSWDADIRFQSAKQETLFFTNYRRLIDAGIQVHIAITVQKHLLDRDPIEVVNQFQGASSIDFELLTMFDAKTQDLKVDNDKWSNWLYRIVEYYLEQEVTWSLPMVDLMVRSMELGEIQDCKCNCCERRTFTLNPNGTVGLCPDKTYISPISSVFELHSRWDEFEIQAQSRIIDTIAQGVGHDMCYACDFYDICGGNCEASLFDHTDECPMSKRVLALIKKHLPVFKNLYQRRGLQQLTELRNDRT